MKTTKKDFGDIMDAEIKEKESYLKGLDASISGNDAEKEKERLYNEIKVKQKYLEKFYTRETNHFVYVDMQISALKTNLTKYLKLAKKAANTYRFSTEQRNRFKKIINRFKVKGKKQLTTEQAVNLFLILKAELKQIKFIK